MIPLSLGRVAELVGGALLDAAPEGRVTGPVVADSRQVRPGALFAALPGEHADGHDFARAAVDAGSIAVLAARPCGVPSIVVDDVTVALARLARALHDSLSAATVIGITGSSGKTGTKDLIAHVLRDRGPTVAPAESYNNELGHPLTVLRADDSTRHLVLELSARGIGHIAHLAGIAPPRIGVVLNVGTAHLGEFGSRAAIAQAKGELVEALPDSAEGGVAVLNADDALVAGMSERTRARVMTYGISAGAEVRAENVRLDASGRPGFTLVTPEERVPVMLGLHGEHHVSNALAAAAVGRELGMPVREVAPALGTAAPVSRWRMEVSERPDGVTVINDAYNANPESTGAALRTAAAMAHGRRCWAVLGHMAELGDDSARAHREIGTLLCDLGVTGVLAVGAEAQPIAEGARRAGAGRGAAGPEAVEVADADGAITAMRRCLVAGDVVLVKGSRVTSLERVAAALHEGAAGGTAQQGGEVPV